MDSIVVSVDCKQSFTSATKNCWYIRDCCACMMPQKETGNTTAEIYWPAIGRFDHDVPRQEPELEHFSGGNDQ